MVGRPKIVLTPAEELERKRKRNEQKRQNYAAKKARINAAVSNLSNPDQASSSTVVSNAVLPCLSTSVSNADQSCSTTTAVTLKRGMPHIHMLIITEQNF